MHNNPRVRGGCARLVAALPLGWVGCASLFAAPAARFVRRAAPLGPEDAGGTTKFPLHPLDSLTPSSAGPAGPDPGMAER